MPLTPTFIRLTLTACLLAGHFSLSATPLLFERVKTENGEKWKTRPSMEKWIRKQEFIADERKLRVVCMGGSATYGFPMPKEGAYPSLLETSLQKLYPDVNPLVVNVGLLNGKVERLNEVADEVTAIQPYLVVLEVGNMEVLARWGVGVNDQPPAYLGDRSLAPPPLDRSVYSGLSLTVAENQYLEGVRELIEKFKKEGVDIILLSPGVNLKANTIYDGSNADVPERLKREVEAVMDLIKQAPDSDIGYKVRCLERVMALVPRSPSFHYIAARYFEDFKLWAKARDAFEKAADRDNFPLRPRTRVRNKLKDLAKELKVPFIDGQSLADGISREGISGYGQFFDHLHPRRDLQVSIAKGILKLMGVEEEKMESDLRKPLEEQLSWNDRVMSEVLCLSGYALSYCGEEGMAKVHFQKSLELNPSNLESLISLSSVLLLEGERPIALALLRKAVSQGNWIFLPDHLKLRMAEGFAIIGDVGSSAKVMEHMGKDAESEEWSSIQAFKHMALGEDEKAIAYFKKALKRSPLHPLLLKGLEFSCDRSKNWIAYVDWLKGRLVDRRSREKVMTLMKRLNDLSENDEALAEAGIELIRLFLGLERKQELLPWLTLAELHGRLGQLHRSKEALERTLLLSSAYDLPLNISMIEKWVSLLQEGINPYEKREESVPSDGGKSVSSGNAINQAPDDVSVKGTGDKEPESSKQ